MIRIVLGFGGFLLPFFPLRILFPLGQPLAVTITGPWQWQGENFGFFRFKVRGLGFLSVLS